MKPETGNNNPAAISTDKELSIRLEADGLSFSTSPKGMGLPEAFIEAGKELPLSQIVAKFISEGKISAAKFDRATLEVDTNEIVIVPVELFSDNDIEGYLRENNLDRGKIKEAVVARNQEFCMIILADTAIAESLRKIWNENLSFRSPIMDVAEKRGYATIRIRLTRRFAYIAVRDDILEYADVMPCSSTADVLYYLAELGKRFDVSHSTISVEGNDVGQTVKKLKKYYPNII